MRVYSLIELFCMTRRELFQLHDYAVRLLQSLPSGDAARKTLFQLMRNIRRVLAQRRT